jgi:Arc/MetJ family transcription regulator
MRTTLDLDDDLVTALVSRHPELTKTEAIEAAIRSYLNESAIDGLRRLAGTLDIEDLSEEFRHRDRHT